MVWHQKHCGNGCFGSACCLHKWSFDIFVLDAGKLWPPLIRMLHTGGEAGWCGMAQLSQGGVPNGCLMGGKGYRPSCHIYPHGLHALTRQNLFHICNKGVEGNKYQHLGASKQKAIVGSLHSNMGVGALLVTSLGRNSASPVFSQHQETFFLMYLIIFLLPYHGILGCLIS